MTKPQKATLNLLQRLSLTLPCKKVQAINAHVQDMLQKFITLLKQLH